MPCGGKTSFVSACKRGWGDGNVFLVQSPEMIREIIFFYRYLRAK